MALLCCVVLVLLYVSDSASATVVADMDYGGVPLWINRLAGEPSVLSLQGRMDPAWFRANNPQACPQQCDCPIQWPTALYCDHRGLADVPDHLPERTQYLFLQVWKNSDTCTELSLHGLPSAHSGFSFPVPSYRNWPSLQYSVTVKCGTSKSVRHFFSFVPSTTTSRPFPPCFWPTSLIYAGSYWTTTSCRATSWTRPPCRTRPSYVTFLPTTTTLNQCPALYQLDFSSCDSPTTKSAASALELSRTCTTWRCYCCKETDCKSSQRDTSKVVLCVISFLYTRSIFFGMESQRVQHSFVFSSRHAKNAEDKL